MFPVSSSRSGCMQYRRVNFDNFLVVLVFALQAGFEDIYINLLKTRLRGHRREIL